MDGLVLSTGGVAVSQRQLNPVAEELSAYFLTADADQGMSSSWEPLVMIYRGGFGGQPDPERRMLDRGFARSNNGVGAENEITRARRARKALLTLSQRHLLALFAAYGPSPRARLDREYGIGMAEKVASALGGLAPGLATLTPVVADGFASADRVVRENDATVIHFVEDDVSLRSRVLSALGCPLPAELAYVYDAPPWRLDWIAEELTGLRRESFATLPRVDHSRSRASLWAHEGGWLVGLCLAACPPTKTSQKKLSKVDRERREQMAKEAQCRLERVRQEARGILAEAEAAYRLARGWKAQETQEATSSDPGPEGRRRPHHQPSRPRRSKFDPFAGIGVTS
jgi:hypothetical protein